MLEKKKGIALNQAFGAVLTLVLVATLVIIGIVIFVSLSASFAGVRAVTIDNETLVTVTEVGVPVSNASNCQFGGFSLSIATLSANGTVIPAASIATTAAGLISFDGGAVTNNNTNWNVSYAFTWGTEACTASDNMIAQFATYPVLVGLVGTIIFLGLVIGVLVSSFVFGRKSGV